MSDLKGEVVVVTGASRGTGRGSLGETAELPLPQSWHHTND
jgi:NAD(P)-dependent dehydrogenase (short-subunit alcohol dehydrogenase family)